MQTQAQIKQLLEEGNLAPNRTYGQNFLIDQNLMAKLLELAEIDAALPILEVGPGTGSLTEELIQRSVRVVAVEIDRGLHGLVQSRLGNNPNLVLIHNDVLSGKHALAPAVLSALGPAAQLVANLPYSIATPLVAQCLLDSWSAGPGGQKDLTTFRRLTFTVQREVGDRMAADLRDPEYGPVSVVVALLGKVTLGPVVPATSFWPRPNIVSRIVRIDFDPVAAGRLADCNVLSAALFFAFNQRRKQIGSVVRRKDVGLGSEVFLQAVHDAGIETTMRAEEISPEQYLALANSLARSEEGRKLVPVWRRGEAER